VPILNPDEIGASSGKEIQHIEERLKEHVRVAGLPDQSVSTDLNDYGLCGQSR